MAKERERERLTENLEEVKFVDKIFQIKLQQSYVIMKRSELLLFLIFIAKTKKKLCSESNKNHSMLYYKNLGLNNGFGEERRNSSEKQTKKKKSPFNLIQLQRTTNESDRSRRYRSVERSYKLFN